MKSRFLFFPILAFIFALLAFRLKEMAFVNQSLSENKADKKINIIRCSPDWNELKGWIDETNIPPIPGAGIYKWKISTNNDSAQLYFNQGINMYYSFHILEAMASGTAVLTARSTAIPEVFGDAVTYAEPLSPEDISEKLLDLVSSNKKRLALEKLGLALSKKYDVRIQAAGYLERFESIAASIHKKKGAT